MPEEQEQCKHEHERDVITAAPQVEQRETQAKACGDDEQRPAFLLEHAKDDVEENGRGDDANPDYRHPDVIREPLLYGPEQLSEEPSPDETSLVVDEPFTDFPRLIAWEQGIGLQEFTETVQTGGDTKQQKDKP